MYRHVTAAALAALVAGCSSTTPTSPSVTSSLGGNLRSAAVTTYDQPSEAPGPLTISGGTERINGRYKADVRFTGVPNVAFYEYLVQQYPSGVRVDKGIFDANPSHQYRWYGEQGTYTLQVRSARSVSGADLNASAWTRPVVFSLGIQEAAPVIAPVVILNEPEEEPCPYLSPFCGFYGTWSF